MQLQGFDVCLWWHDVLLWPSTFRHMWCTFSEHFSPLSTISHGNGTGSTARHMRPHQMVTSLAPLFASSGAALQKNSGNGVVHEADLWGGLRWVSAACSVDHLFGWIWKAPGQCWGRTFQEVDVPWAEAGNGMKQQQQHRAVVLKKSDSLRAVDNGDQSTWWRWDELAQCRSAGKPWLENWFQLVDKEIVDMTFCWPFCNNHQAWSLQGMFWKQKNAIQDDKSFLMPLVPVHGISRSARSHVHAQWPWPGLGECASSDTSNPDFAGHTNTHTHTHLKHAWASRCCPPQRKLILLLKRMSMGFSGYNIGVFGNVRCSH